MPGIKDWKLFGFKYWHPCQLQEVPVSLRQPKMVSVVIRLFDHFTLESIPLINSIGIVVFVNHLHICVTNFKPSLMFSKLSILTSNNVIWVNFSALFFRWNTARCQNIHDGLRACFLWDHQSLYWASKFCVDVFHLWTEGVVFDYLFHRWLRLIFELPEAKLLHECFSLRLFTTQEKSIKTCFF